MNDFESIRPYNEDEISAATQRMAESSLIPSIGTYLMPDLPVETLRNRIRNVHTCHEFQRDLLVEIVEILLKKTATDFNCSGLEAIRKGTPCLFVSNHRDIVLDAVLLQYALIVRGYKTSYIAFGDNLMYGGLVTDFWKTNKMFQIHRGGTQREFYNNLLLISKYINYLINEKKESVWISQRNGRTKDGVDFTDPAVLKMFGMSCRDDRVAILAKLNIVPVAVSYEWESCDKLKAMELYLTKKNGYYEKKQGEDLNSILTGIMQLKGHVHFHICEPVTEADLMRLKDCSSVDYYRHIALLMDHRINSNFYLHSNNYIAHDLRSGMDTYAEHYTAEQKATFIEYMEWMNDYHDFDRSGLEEFFLGIYANPIDSKNKRI